MPHRAVLPTRRPTYSFPIEFVTGNGNTIQFLASYGTYPDGRVSEAFLETGKAGTDIQALASDAAIVFSIALQYGVPIDVLRGSLCRDSNGTPLSLIGALIDGVISEVNK